MYIFYKIDELQIELLIPEKDFIKKVEKDFDEVNQLFSKYEKASDDFKVCPNSKTECKWMIQAYCKLSEDKLPLPDWLRWYFGFCFELLLRGVSPEKALGLNNPRHRPKESRTAERNEKIYFEILNLMQNKVTLFEAALELSEKYNLNESHIQNIYSGVKKSKIIKDDIQEIFKLDF